MDTPACVIYVRRKKPEAELAKGEVLPRSVVVDGGRIETDVVETGRIYAHELRDRERPALAGISIGHENVTAGTLGCFVLDKANGDRLSILSNNHVLADINRGVAGDAIYQPGPADAPKVAENVIARLTRFVPIDFGGTSVVDCAVADLNVDCAIVDDIRGDMTRPSPEQPAVGLLFAGGADMGVETRTFLSPINEVAARLDVEMTAGAAARSGVGPEDVQPPGAPVQKTGRTTLYTTGRIQDIDVLLEVNMGDGRAALFDNQIAVTGMSCPGDSGSIVCRGGTGDVSLTDCGCVFLATAEEVTGVPWSQEWEPIRYARDKYLANSLTGRWVIDTFFDNRNQQSLVQRVQEAHAGEVPEEDRAFVQAVYDQYFSEAKLALYDPDRDDIRVTQQHVTETQDAIDRARKYMLLEEADAVQEVFELCRDRVLGKNGRELIALLDDATLYQRIREIAAESDSISDPYD
ncbi:hypothetical protein [Actinomadura sp. 6K520]|uniref:hypothetical protein n=1 Tax=Actinomadura sp. 6K520 TaxID=2530364 RepID=UPI001404B1D7|nr:hypothetical protein [Actinomadura sp. 6K520]